MAFELADSGRHENFGDIAYALQFERGLATTLIDDPDMRRQLNVRCANARERASAEPPPAAVIANAAPSLFRRAASALSRSGAPVAALNSATS
nr:hypothetical protein [Caballeronia sp. ATUFL_M2_KS44]